MLYFSVFPDEYQDFPAILKPSEVAEFLYIHKNTVCIQEEFFLYNPSSQLTETSSTLEKTGNS